MPRQCPNFIDTYLQYTQFQEAPVLFHKWVAVSLIGSVLRRNVWIDRHYFKVFPNFYTCLVGPTGAVTKSSAANIGIGILSKTTGIDVMKEKMTSWSLLEWFKDMTGAKGRCCCTIYAPEMKNFLADLNKAEMVPLLTSFYDCPDDPEHRTKGGGILKFKNICINLLTCSTPEWLITGTSMDDIQGGFTGRFIYIYQETTPRSFPFPEDQVKANAHISQLSPLLLNDLHIIAGIQGEFTLTNQAKGEYTLWYGNRKQEWENELLMGYYTRKPTYLIKLAMILSAAEGESRVIDEFCFRSAMDLLNDTEKTMGKSFSGIVSDPALRYKDMILGQIIRAPQGQITKAELLRKNWSKLDSVMLSRIIESLADSGLLKPPEQKVVEGTITQLLTVKDRSIVI